MCLEREIEPVRFAWEGRVLFNAVETEEEKNSFAERCIEKFESLKEQISTEEYISPVQR